MGKIFKKHTSSNQQPLLAGGETVASTLMSLGWSHHVQLNTKDDDKDNDIDKDNYIGLSKVCGNMLPHTQISTFLTF